MKTDGSATDSRGVRHLHFPSHFVWQVEYTRKAEGSNYATNRSLSVVCKRIEEAIQHTYSLYPEVTIIKVLRGQRWGNDGVVIPDEPPQEEPTP